VAQLNGGEAAETDPDDLTFGSGYFQRKAPASEASRLSLADLGLDLQSTEGLRALLAKLPTKHHNLKEQLLVDHKVQFPSWRFELRFAARSFSATPMSQTGCFCILCRQGFSLLLYGVGSKRQLLDAFAQETLTDGGVLVVDGLHKNGSVKHILVTALCALRRAPPTDFRHVCLTHSPHAHNTKLICDPQGNARTRTAARSSKRQLWQAAVRCYP
jgi:origin recognition complex subunit 2